MLTNDRLNAEAAGKDGLNAVSVRKFTAEVFPDLIDKVAGCSEESVEVDRNIDYPAYMSLSQIQLQMKSGGIVQGKLEISRDNYLEGILRDGDKEILIQGSGGFFVSGP